MQLSRFGQGLATTAVSALMISGLTLTAPAYAADGAGVRLLSQQDGVASVRNQFGGMYGGTSTIPITLAAEQLDTAAVVTFEYNADPAAGDAASGWMAVPGSSSASGRYLTIDWAPDSALVGTSIALRAVATTETATTYSTRNNVALSGLESPVNSVLVESAAPFFAQPYADSDHTQSLLAVSGSTSATDGDVTLSAWNPASGAFEGDTVAAVTSYSMKFPGFPYDYTINRFDGVLDISGFDAGDGDVLALRAERDSDDVLPVVLDEQQIGAITGSSDSVGGPDTTPVLIRVTDEDDRAVNGAEVRRSADGTLVGYTDSAGEVRTDQASDTTETYYANTTDANAYQEGVDVITDAITTPAYVPTAAGTEAEFADGTAFDDQEYEDGDIVLQVVDGRGDAFASEEEVSYAITRSGTEDPVEPTTATTDGDGRLVVPFDPEMEDGAYTLIFTAPSSAGGTSEQPVDFVAGDAVLGLTPLTGTSPSGGTIAYEGTLTVEGQALADRDVALAYTRGTEQAPGTAADAGLGAERALTGVATTGDDGTFTVTVGDLVEAGGPAESGGRLAVTVLGDTLEATADFTAVPVPTPTPTLTPTPTPTPTTTPTPTPAPGKITVALRLKGSNARPDSDRLRVLGPDSVAGQKVRIHVQAPGGSWRAVEGIELDRDGDATVTLDDTNGDEVTRYRVRLVPNRIARAFTSGALRLR